MRKTAIFILILVLLAVSSGCGSRVPASQKAADTFIRSLYTVDEKKIDELRALEPGRAAMQAQAAAAGSKTEALEIYAKFFEAFDSHLRPLLTEDGYRSLLESQYNTYPTYICTEGRFAAKVTTIKFEEYDFGDGQTKAGYYFTAGLRFLSADGSDEKTANASGYLSLILEDGRWSVSLVKIISSPEL